jgi:hypothetical protein
LASYQEVASPEHRSFAHVQFPCRRAVRHRRETEIDAKPVKYETRKAERRAGERRVAD